MNKVQETLTILSDRNWHCKTCEFSPNLDSTIKEIKRYRKVELEQGKGKHLYEKMFCPVCQRETKHIKIKYMPGENPNDEAVKSINQDKTNTVEEQQLQSNSEINFESISAEVVTDKETIKMNFPFDSYTKEIAVFPVKEKKEKFRPIPVGKENDPSYTFIISKENVKLREAACKKCQEIKKRQPSIDGIAFFWYGRERYEGTCKGCFWGTPNEWREIVKMKLGIS